MKKIVSRVKKCFSMILIGIIVVSGIFPVSEASAENYLDTAPSITPTTANGYKVLFDNTHGQTAGAADWVIDGGFSDYADGLAEAGFYVQELRKDTAITYEDLAQYDVFIIPEANVPYKTSEQEAIVEYVQNGGSVFFIADHYNADRNKNRWDASEVFNGYRRGAYSDPTSGMSTEEAASEAMQDVESSDWLAENFGVRFRYNALGDIDATTIVDADECFGITENVESVAMHAGSTIAIIDPTIAKGIVYLPDGLTEDDAWSSAVDDGVYNGGGVEEGAYVAISKVGLGKAAFIGDSSAVEDSTPKYKKEETGGTKTTYDGYDEADDSTLLLQLTQWLAEQEDYTTLEETGVTLDSATTLYDYETPEDSTEPATEPWGTPSTGYKWWDETTFKTGSYGYTGTEETTADPEYTFELPDTIVAGEELTITVNFSGLTANTTYENYRIGAYTSGGTQILRVADEDGTYPTSAGYSSYFTITTDSEGNASKELNCIITEGVTGSFSLRLKQSSTNLVTKTYSVSEATATETPSTEVATATPAATEETQAPTSTDVAVTEAPATEVPTTEATSTPSEEVSETVAPTEEAAATEAPTEEPTATATPSESQNTVINTVKTVLQTITSAIGTIAKNIFSSIASWF